VESREMLLLVLVVENGWMSSLFPFSFPSFALLSLCKQGLLPSQGCALVELFNQGRRYVLCSRSV
jgi:hypothetical protein